jgi:hypothetical protein
MAKYAHVIALHTSIGLNDRNRPIAIKAKKHINHAAIRDTDTVIDRIKLSIERHLSVAGWAVRPSSIFKTLRLSAKSMPSSNLVLPI